MPAENLFQGVEELRRLLDSLSLNLQSPSGRQSVQALCDYYLEWSATHNSKGTYNGYKAYCQSFCAHAFGPTPDAHTSMGTLAVMDLRPFHVTDWLDSHPEWKGSRRNAITAVKRVFNHAEREGMIDISPLRKLTKPPCKQRVRVLTQDEKAKILGFYAAKDPFRDYVFALLHTGARPGEVAKIEAQHVSLEDCTWTLESHKTLARLREPKPRVIYLTPPMLALTKRLMERFPTGPLFRGRYGRKITRNAVRCRFRALRKALGMGKDVVAYTCRHTWITDALEAGVPTATVAELTGTSEEMIRKHYSKLSSRKSHLLAMANQAAQNSKAG